MTTIAFLGTGLMGTAFVQGLLARRHEVRVWNRTLERARPLARQGARLADQPDEAVRGAERVHLCLADDTAVDAVLDRVVDALDPQAVVIDHSTVSPAGVVARAARLAERNVGFLHAPVFMTPDNARAATGLMVCAGPRAVLASVRPELESLTGDLWYLGERPDKAAVFKLLGNAMIVSIVAGFADAMALARAAAIDPVEAQELFTRFNPGKQLEVRGARMARGDFKPSFELGMARKDVRLMVELAERADLPLRLLPTLAQRMDALLERGHARSDLGVLAIEVVPNARQRS